MAKQKPQAALWRFVVQSRNQIAPWQIHKKRVLLWRTVPGATSAKNCPAVDLSRPPAKKKVARFRYWPTYPRPLTPKPPTASPFPLFAPKVQDLYRILVSERLLLVCVPISCACALHIGNAARPSGTSVGHQGVPAVLVLHTPTATTSSSLHDRRKRVLD